MKNFINFFPLFCVSVTFPIVHKTVATYNYLASTLPNAKLRSVAFANYESRKTSTMLTRLKLTRRAFHDSLSAGGRVLTDNGLLPRLEFIGAIGIGRTAKLGVWRNFRIITYTHKQRTHNFILMKIK
jgi:hypothetical protein